MGLLVHDSSRFLQTSDYSIAQHSMQTHGRRRQSPYVFQRLVGEARADLAEGHVHIAALALSHSAQKGGEALPSEARALSEVRAEYHHVD